MKTDSAVITKAQETTAPKGFNARAATSTSISDLRLNDSNTQDSSTRTLANTEFDTVVIARFEPTRSELDETDFDQGVHQLHSSQAEVITLQLAHTNTSNSNELSSDMGYTVTNTFNPWNAHDSTVKMENENVEIASRESEGKDFEVEGEESSSPIPPVEEQDLPGLTNNGRLSTSGRLPSSTFGTPSTVSTVPSCDDVSVDFLFEPPAVEKHPWMGDDVALSNSVSSPMAAAPSLNRLSTNAHHRSPSWDEAPGISYTPHSQPYQTAQNHWAHRTTGHHSQGRHAGAWSSPSNARVASFRTDQQTIDSNGHYNYFQPSFTEAWRQQRRPEEHQQQYYVNHQQMAYLPPSGQHHFTRKQTRGTSQSPPRIRANARPVSSRQPGSSISSSGPQSLSANLPRSSSEVLKTLLRKKACLYEPHTSKAVALVTWLVGRELALSYGYFSRQQLQSGVHACVAHKIDSGAITRTKVNRCMQIILNCCFHYIIPRSDGSEESGELFCQQFKETSKDDKVLLSTLLPPWNDVTVMKDVVLQASLVEEGQTTKKGNAWTSPQQSPRLTSVETPGGTSQEGEGEDPHMKRSVLLCFNENVRSAEDTFRCHNEFIRDAANAARLQLTASEWSAFFGEDAGKPSVWNNEDAASRERCSDFFGQMDDNELGMFRTSWCAKRYDHDHELCGFAHMEVNGGWLRRNSQLYSYRAEMCTDVVSVPPSLTGGSRLAINKCRHGICCTMAHSREEIAFHPSNYKRSACKLSGTTHGCTLGDVCPNYHRYDEMHTVKVPGHDNHLHQRHTPARHHNPHDHAAPRAGRPIAKVSPSGAPTLYVSPSPFSSFEKQLLMPGLQSLFRRRCSVVSSYLESSGTSGFVQYEMFGPEGDIGKDDFIRVRNETSHRQ